MSWREATRPMLSDRVSASARSCQLACRDNPKWNRSTQRFFVQFFGLQTNGCAGHAGNQASIPDIIFLNQNPESSDYQRIIDDK
jgi:hypothetical protein